MGCFFLQKNNLNTINVLTMYSFRVIMLLEIRNSNQPQIKGEKKMTDGQRYVKENFANELDYEKAVEESKKELIAMGITDRTQIYDNDEIFDSPVYPQNAKLYDEFCDECGFNTLEYFLFIAKRIERY